MVFSSLDYWVDLEDSIVHLIKVYNSTNFDVYDYQKKKKKEWMGSTAGWYTESSKGNQHKNLFHLQVLWIKLMNNLITLGKDKLHTHL